MRAFLKIPKTFFIQSLPVYTSCLFSMFLKDNIVNIKKSEQYAIVICIFHESDSLRLLMMSYRHGLILLKYFSNDSVLNLSPLLSYLV